MSPSVDRVWLTAEPRVQNTPRPLAEAKVCWRMGGEPTVQGGGTEAPSPRAPCGQMSEKNSTGGKDFSAEIEVGVHSDASL